MGPAKKPSTDAVQPPPQPDPEAVPPDPLNCAGIAPPIASGIPVIVNVWPENVVLTPALAVPAPKFAVSDAELSTPAVAPEVGVVPPRNV